MTETQGSTFLTMNIENLILEVKDPEIRVTDQQKETVKRILGEETLRDILRSIEEYIENPMDAELLSKRMFSCGVLYATGRISNKYRI